LWLCVSFFAKTEYGKTAKDIVTEISAKIGNSCRSKPLTSRQKQATIKNAWSRKVAKEWWLHLVTVDKLGTNIYSLSIKKLDRYD